MEMQSILERVCGCMVIMMRPCDIESKTWRKTFQSFSRILRRTHMEDVWCYVASGGAENSGRQEPAIDDVHTQRQEQP